MKLTVDIKKTYQTMTGFGVSGAWWAQLVGKWESVDEASGKKTRERISELLFSRENGIGIGIYRYNLGSGSARSGKGEYSDPARRADSFETADGYDFTRDAAAVTMLRQAVKDGVENVIFFVNSPIEKLTKNGLGHLKKSRTGRTNLARKNVPAFCKYCLDVTEHFLNEGIPIKYISPVNEPLWVWNGGQEGCHYSPRQAARVFRAFADGIRARDGLNGLKLSGMENGDIRWFNKSYTRRLLKDEKVRLLTDGVDVHSYCLPSPLPAFFNDRLGYLKRFRRYMDRRFPDAPVNVSEWTHMCGGKDVTMKSALEQARVMYEDISLLNAASWQHWIACSMYDYCDGLIYLDTEHETFEMTKRYYAFGNFTKFIGEGFVRTEIAADDPDVLPLCFVKDGRRVLVLVNPSGNEKSFTAETDTKVFVTDETDDLKEYSFPAGAEIRIGAESVNTVVTEEEKT